MKNILHIFCVYRFVYSCKDGEAVDLNRGIFGWLKWEVGVSRYLPFNF